jgi:ribulose-5-phosphate 4-epimerase/fuculose-1-phosphate aldolase
MADMRLCLAALTIAMPLALASMTAAQTPPPPSGGPVDPALIEQLVTAGRILADQGVLDAYGHVSFRHPANSNRYFLARAMAPAIVTATDIMEYDLDSNPVDRRGRGMFLERAIHGEIYKARDDVNAIVHSHSPAVIPFGVTQVPMRPVFHTAAFLHVGVPVWDIAEEAGVTDMLVRTATLGKSLAKTLADKPVVLMRGHGNVVVGPTVKRAGAPTGRRARPRRPDPLHLPARRRRARPRARRRGAHVGHVGAQGVGEVGARQTADSSCRHTAKRV